MIQRENSSLWWAYHLLGSTEVHGAAFIMIATFLSQIATALMPSLASGSTQVLYPVGSDAVVMKSSIFEYRYR
eukprot:scaffold39452_cov40-Attheya_sp.AAC.3